MAIQTAPTFAVPSAQNGHADNPHEEQSKDSIPDEYHPDLFDSIREAAVSHDLRRLLDTISDWAATAQLYADPDLAAELTEAIGARKGAADWLNG